MSHNWKNILVSADMPMRKLLTVIDNEALKIALVVESDNKLLGCVSDGDIRRALINGKDLNTCAQDIMNPQPIIAEFNSSKEALIELMETNELVSIPLIDDNKVVGLETLHNLLHKVELANPVFIMAGGFGTRLRPLTDNCPKPMLQVGDKPILETLILQFIKKGFSNFYISTHFLPQVIEEYFGEGSDWGVKITYVYEKSPLGTGGALGLLPKDIAELPLIMINGDVLTSIDFEKLLSFHNQKNATATMCVKDYEYQVPFGVIESRGTNITSMVEKPTHRYSVNAGIYVVSPQIYKSVKTNEKIDMPTLLERNLDENVHLYTFHDYWLDIGRVDDFKRAQSDIKLLDI